MGFVLLYKINIRLIKMLISKPSAIGNIKQAKSVPKNM
jgi:hypothetical protein